MCANTKLIDIGFGHHAFRASIIRNIQLREQRFGLEPEITAKLARARCRICEVGIGADSHNGKQGVAMRGPDAVRAFYAVSDTTSLRAAPALSQSIKIDRK